MPQVFEQHEAPVEAAPTPSARSFVYAISSRGRGALEKVACR